jgi:D-sedoheptulose 7-phosphate isomerase
MPEPTMGEQIAEHQRLASLVATQTGLLERIADRILEAFGAGHRLYLLGNGGSAADAQHIAAELVGRFKADHPPQPATALTTDTSILTAVTNDFGGDEIFVRQVRAQVRAGDIVWALSVSGRSPNVLRAVEEARARGAFLVGFTGRRGAMLTRMCDLCFVVDHDESDRVQEMHVLAYHLICGRIEAALGAADTRSG